MKTEFTVSNHNYQIKKMNMIERLVSWFYTILKRVELTQKFYNEVPEHFEEIDEPVMEFPEHIGEEVNE